MTARRKTKIQLPDISKDKVLKVWQEKFGPEEVIVESTPFRQALIFSIFVNLFFIVLVLILTLAFKSIIPPQIPLFYGEPEGKEQLAQNWLLILPSLVSLIIIFVNYGLTLISKEEFLKKALILSGIAATFFSAITTIKIILLIGSL